MLPTDPETAGRGYKQLEFDVRMPSTVASTPSQYFRPSSRLMCESAWFCGGLLASAIVSGARLGLMRVLVWLAVNAKIL